MFNSNSTGITSIPSSENYEHIIPQRRSERVKNLPEKDSSTISDTEDRDAEAQASSLSGLTRGVNRKRKRELNVVSEGSISSGGSNLNINSEATSLKPPFECDQCDTKFKLLIYLRKHEKYAHTDKPPEFACLPCDKKFRTTTLLKQHQRMKVHMKQVGEGSSVNDSRLHDDQLKYECEQCDKKFKMPYYLLRHQRDVHTEELAYECFLCDKKFKSGASLRQHEGSAEHRKREERHFHNLENMLDIETVEEKRPRLVNSTLPMTSPPMQENETPQVNLSSSQTHPCNICGKVLTTKLTLKQHQMLHNGDAPVECIICEKKFQSENNYKYHLQTKKHKFRSLGKMKKLRKQKNYSKSLNKPPPQHEHDASAKPEMIKEAKILSQNIPGNQNIKNGTDVLLGVSNHAEKQSVSIMEPPAAPVNTKELPHQENVSPENFQFGILPTQIHEGFGFPAYFPFPFSFPPYQHFPDQVFPNQGVYQGGIDGIPWNPVPFQNTVFPLSMQSNTQQPLVHQQAGNGFETFLYNPNAG